jgi:hypothetical protein
MERKAIGFEQLSDLVGYRVLVRRSEDCYQALGIVPHDVADDPGRFKDYISTPKQNDYRSIHTTVIGPAQQRVELQIRTRAMHEIAEYGIAAHALYKDGHGSPSEMLSRESNAYAWLRHTIELLAEGVNSEEFLEHTKLELFHDQVFCFTPKGRLIALPRKATPIDFRLCGAYRRRQQRGRRQDQRQDRAAGRPSFERRRGRDPDSKAQVAPPAAWEDRGHRQGARGDPAATRVAVRSANTPSSAGASSSGCASAPSATIPTRSSLAR